MIGDEPNPQPGKRLEIFRFQHLNARLSFPGALIRGAETAVKLRFPRQAATLGEGAFFRTHAHSSGYHRGNFRPQRDDVPFAGGMDGIRQDDDVGIRERVYPKRGPREPAVAERADRKELTAVG